MDTIEYCFSYKGVLVIRLEQFSLFSEESKIVAQEISATKNTPDISARLLDSFDVSDIPFLGCDYQTVYPDLKQILPNETVSFDFSNINISIACEIVCSAICHQMNWDFLRGVVREKTLSCPSWLEPENLARISGGEVGDMLADYHKPERIRSDERAFLLRDVGKMAQSCGDFKNIFLDRADKMISQAQIRQTMLRCQAFSHDPEEKKLQLLFQKLSNYPQLKELSLLCKPAVDYHLIRCFLRRGLITPRNKYGEVYITSQNVSRKESTVGALRQLCAWLLLEISNYTDLNINSVNQIEWLVGRSICVEGLPDCYLKNSESQWVRDKYDVCPFHSTCCALNYNHKMFHIQEPTYLGQSY